MITRFKGRMWIGKINRKVLPVFSAFAGETRLRILLRLSERPKTANEIHEHIGKDEITLSAVSHQLNLLTSLNMISCEKKGRAKIFQLADTFCWCILQDAFEHFKEKTKCRKCERIRNELYNNGQHKGSGCKPSLRFWGKYRKHQHYSTESTEHTMKM